MKVYYIKCDYSISLYLSSLKGIVMFGDIIMNFAIGVIVGIIGTLLLFVYVKIVLPPTKTTFWITGAITFIMLLIGWDKEYHLSYHYSIAAQILIVLWEPVLVL